jgi:hypothetical protein
MRLFRLTRLRPSGLPRHQQAREGVWFNVEQIVRLENTEHGTLVVTTAGQIEVTESLQEVADLIRQHQY